MTERHDPPAGGFSSWLHRTRLAQVEDTGADVPCGECVACCRASYFIHIGPEESQTITRIPVELLFPAPGRPKGTVVLGYDEHGRCPMLRGDGCSIYDDRPLTCRAYDCRMFAAAGIAADRAEITERARRWRFDYPIRDDHARHTAVNAAARFLQEHTECFPAGAIPENPADVAVLAIKVYEVFLEGGAPWRAASDADVANALRERASTEHLPVAKLANDLLHKELAVH